MTAWRLEPTLMPPSSLYYGITPTVVFPDKFEYRLFASEDHWQGWVEWAQDPDNLASYDISVSFASHAFSGYVIQLKCNLNGLTTKEGSGCCVKQAHHT